MISLFSVTRTTYSQGGEWGQEPGGVPDDEDKTESHLCGEQEREPAWAG